MDKHHCRASVPARIVRCLALLLFLLLLFLLTSCGPVAGANPRATAESVGCWPYGAYQPPVADARPAPTATVRPDRAPLGTTTAPASTICSCRTYEASL